MGHYLGLAYLGRGSMGMLPTPVYCTAAMRGFLSTNGPWRLLVDEGRLVFPDIAPNVWTTIDGAFQARMTLVPHRQEYSDTVAWEFRAIRRTLLYLPDIDAWNRWDRRIEDVVRDVDVALLDGAFFRPDEVPGRPVETIPHPMIPDTMTRLAHLTGGTRRIVFTHLNNTNPVLDEGSSEATQVRNRGFEIAREGTIFTL
jgi:pyrroloquinoline quinone biosynthesis protein B